MLTPSFPVYCHYSDHWIFGNNTKIFFLEAPTCSDIINILKLCHDMQLKQKSVQNVIFKELQRFSGIIKLKPKEFVFLILVLLKSKINSVVIIEKEFFYSLFLSQKSD